MKKQPGFAVLEAILILAIVAIIGGTGYFLWHSRHTSASSKSTTTGSHLMTKYSNAKLGFQFSYPSSWGNAQLSQLSDKAQGYRLSFVTHDGSANQYSIAINDVSLQKEMGDDAFSNIVDYNIVNNKLTLIMIDGSADSNITILKSSDGTVLFTGGKYSDYVAGIKNVNYITGMKKASIIAANDLDHNSSEVQQNISRLLQSFKPAEK